MSQSILQHDERKPMSDFGAKLFEQATSELRETRRARRYAAVILEIAERLAEADALDAGLDDVDLSKLTEASRERYLLRAQRAVDEGDPSFGDQRAERAAEEIQIWGEGIFRGQGTEPTFVDAAREGIARFRALTSGPNRPTPAGKCFCCGGVFWTSPERPDVKVCGSCGHHEAVRRG